LALGRPAEALASFDRALAIRRRMRLRTIIAPGAVSLERHAEALASFDRALEFAPRSAPSLQWRAQALLDLGRPLEALASLDRTVTLAAADSRRISASVAFAISTV